MKRYMFLLVLFLGAQSAFSTTINVPGDYTTFAQAFQNVSDGDTILVAPGLYQESISFGDKDIVFMSSGGRDVTILEPSGPSQSVIEFLGYENTSIVDGFTIRGAYRAFGVYCIHASPTVRNCDISYNTTVWHDGAGFCLDTSGIKIINNRIHHNDGSVTGGGIACHGYQTDVQIIGNQIYANRAPHGSGIGCPAIEYNIGSYVENVYIADNLIYDNIEEPKGTPPPGYEGDISEPDGYMAAGIYIHGYNCQVVNNTVVNNPRGIMILKGDGILIENNIVAYNDMNGISANNATTNCNDVFENGYGGSPGFNGIVADPLFCNLIAGDFHLSPGSPCLPENNSCGVLMGALGVGDCRGYAVISIDRSGSMSLTDPMGQSRLERAKALAHTNVDNLLYPDDPEAMQIAVMYFNADGIVLQQDFTSDPVLLYDAIEAVPEPRHDTPLAAAMCQAHCTMANMGDGAKLLFTYTDGLENESPNFDMCTICEPCNQYFSSGWNFDCDPTSPQTCTEWQLCLYDALSVNGTTIVNYFGQPINPFTKGGVANGLEDILYLKAAAEASDGYFHYYSDLKTICGDANSDGDINVSDAVFIINFVFAGTEPPSDIDAANVNCDGSVNVSDAVWIINYIFTGGNLPCDTDGDGNSDCL